jgi:MSHA biogenesis protein MshP
MKPHLITRRLRGFGAIAALVVLLLLSSLAAAIVRLGWTSQTLSAQDMDTSRAVQTANAGIQWGLYQVLKGGAWSACVTPTQTLDLRSTTGFMVTVTCSYKDYSEGEKTDGSPQSVRLYLVDATACNTNTTCPDNARAGQPNYVERRMRVQVTN